MPFTKFCKLISFPELRSRSPLMTSVSKKKLIWNISHQITVSCNAVCSLSHYNNHIKEAATRDVLYKKMFLEISQNSQENTYARDFSIKLQALACNFIKKESLAQVFSCEFCEISRNTFFTELLRTTAFTIPQLALNQWVLLFWVAVFKFKNK